jgi:calcineurin-like phosphoesterase family protein
MAGNIWLTSDTHFNHTNILSFEDKEGTAFRGSLFDDVNHMNETMINNWNRVVQPGDKVYHLGDVFFGSKDKFKVMWPRLNGSKRLVVGNHDDIKFLSAGGFFRKVFMWRLFKEFDMLLTHVPIHESSFRKVNFNVHGHIHQQESPTPMHHCVCVEHTNYTPVNIETVRDTLKRKL